MKRRLYLFELVKSPYCLFVFISSFFMSYFLIPETVFYGWYNILAVSFMFIFALTITCLIMNIKKKIIIAKTYKSSLLGILATAIGLSALQVCGVGAPVCGAAVGIGLFSSIMPEIFMSFLTKFSPYLILISIILQTVSLYYMNCFKELGG